MKTIIVGSAVWLIFVAATGAIVAWELGKALLGCVVAGSGKDWLREIGE